LTERPLNGVLQPCRREGPVWIVEPPFSAGERLTVDDPKPSVALFRSSGRSAQETVVRESGREIPARG